MDKIKNAWREDPMNVIITGAIAAVAAGTLLSGVGYVMNSAGVLINATKK